jgi:hypothetical protein
MGQPGDDAARGFPTVRICVVTRELVATVPFNPFGRRFFMPELLTRMAVPYGCAIVQSLRQVADIGADRLEVSSPDISPAVGLCMLWIMRVLAGMFGKGFAHPGQSHGCGNCQVKK